MKSVTERAVSANIRAVLRHARSTILPTAETGLYKIQMMIKRVNNAKDNRYKTVKPRKDMPVLSLVMQIHVLGTHVSRRSLAVTVRPMALKSAMQADQTDRSAIQHTDPHV